MCYREENQSSLGKSLLSPFLLNIYLNSATCKYLQTCDRTTCPTTFHSSGSSLGGIPAYCRSLSTCIALRCLHFLWAKKALHRSNRLGRSSDALHLETHDVTRGNRPVAYVLNCDGYYRPVTVSESSQRDRQFKRRICSRVYLFCNRASRCCPN